MEKKQGLFTRPEEETARGISRARSPARSTSPIASLLPRRRGSKGGHHRAPTHTLSELLTAKSGTPRAPSKALAPLAEGPPDPAAVAGYGFRRDGWGQWVKGHLARSPSTRRSDLRLLLGVMGAPLAPVRASPAADPPPHLSIRDNPIERSSAQYILQQYTAASGGQKLQSSIRNAYAMGKVRVLAPVVEAAAMGARHRWAESGSFVLWQMSPGMWSVELAVGGSEVHAGCDGNLVWRHTPWVGARAAKGPPRPLRRALQGLDPGTTARVFAGARCVGEKKVDGEDCFVLQLCADPATLRARSQGPAETIRHALLGYFSQRTALLVHLNDSHLTRIQPGDGGDAVYWETTISSSLGDYRPVEGLMVAHSGRSSATLFRFGEAAPAPACHSRTRMEEAWTVEEVAFNVPGLSSDCFIPPGDVRRGPAGEPC
uniref:Histone transcription regulator 3 n=1 Tax=Anthurium amnicola TaxID=1678845 RepID=A0A1D1Y1P1_9ARAE